MNQWQHPQAVAFTDNAQYVGSVNSSGLLQQSMMASSIRMNRSKSKTPVFAQTAQSTIQNNSCVNIRAGSSSRQRKN